VNQIKNRVEEFGIYADPDMVAVTVAAMLEWITTTTAGKSYFVQLFGFDWSTGHSDRTYELTESRELVKGEDITFLRTAIVRGMFVPPGSILVEKADKKGCDDCGILAHCTREVREHTGALKSICNQCLTLSQNADWNRNSGGSKECERCTVVLCEHHPSKNRLQLYAGGNHG
jgi:hypothetical protein